MLDYLHIKNVALIDEQFINFSDGFNIVTGETGAGKSMVIDSINFVLGEKVSKDFIRKGAENAFVEVLFFLKDSTAMGIIKDMGIDIDSSNSIVITREFNKSGRTVCRVNGRIVTLNMIKDISSILIDIHGQHEHQSLLSSAKHIILLDRFCGEALQKLKDEFRVEYRNYRDIQNKIHQLSGDSQQRQQKIDLLQYQINEIESSNLRLGEEEELIQQKKLLSNSEKLSNGVDEINLLLNGDDSENIGALNQIDRASNLLKDLSDIDISISEISKSFENIAIQLGEAVLDLRHYSRNIEHNPQSLYEIEERLNLIYNLKKKYGSDISEILAYFEKIKNELEFISNSEDELKKLEYELKVQKSKLDNLCKNMSNIRKDRAELIQQRIENILTELEMKNAQFKIQIDTRNNFTDNGTDRVEFLISPNAGESLKPLAKIASGGEMSRVMLALKTVLADVDNVETLIFDEIDAGISGRTAQKVAEKMSYIAKNHQILCITHLPQIAAMADSHYLIEKIENQNNTVTNVYNLTPSQSVEELARLIGGAVITEATKIAAKEMKELATECKLEKFKNEFQ